MVSIRSGFFRLIMFPFLSSATLLLTKNCGTIFRNKTKKILRDRITLLGKSFGCIKSMWLLYCRFQFFEFEPFVSYWKIYIAREQNTRTANNFIHYNVCQNISNAAIRLTDR